MPVQTAKIVLAMVGVALFFLGAKLGMPALRWGAIVLVSVAFLLRLYKPRSR